MTGNIINCCISFTKGHFPWIQFDFYVSFCPYIWIKMYSWEIYIYICTYIHFYVTAWKGFTLLEVWWREWRNRGDGEGCRSRIGREWREAIGNWQVEWNEKPSWWKGDTRMNRGAESNREFGMKGACKREKKKRNILHSQRLRVSIASRVLITSCLCDLVAKL